MLSLTKMPMIIWFCKMELIIDYVEVNDGKWPSKSFDDDAGFDLVANGDENGMWAEKSHDTCLCGIGKCPVHNPLLGRVFCGATLKVKCGFKMAMPTGWFADVRPRSGMATRFRVLPANTPGTIDAGYRDEISVCLMNLGSTPLDVYRGDRVAQMLFLPVPKVTGRKVEKLPDSSRGVGGYGSTGR